MLRKIITLVIAAFIMCSCSVTLKSKRIQYNGSKEMFEYKFNKNHSMVLRNNELQLIDSINKNEFQKELTENKNRYPYFSRVENDLTLKKSDFNMAILYNKASVDLNRGNYRESINKLTQLETLYNDIALYSDILFLKGYAYESLENNDSAKFHYNKFVSLSSQKYSSRFRGNRNLDFGDTTYIKERDYAKQFLSQKEQTYIIYL